MIKAIAVGVLGMMICLVAPSPAASGTGCAAATTSTADDPVPDCRVEFAPDAGPDKRCYRVDCNLITRTLHEFKPQWTARRGVEELYEAYRRVGLTLDEFEGPKYKRIDHVKQLIDRGRSAASRDRSTSASIT